jgi:hypothetical protein
MDFIIGFFLTNFYLAERNIHQMSSIIEGYNYDIFISYRQKDNKGDKWVSQFVDSLKTD